MRGGGVAAVLLGGLLVGCQQPPPVTSFAPMTKAHESDPSPAAEAVTTPTTEGSAGATAPGFKPAFTPSVPLLVNQGGAILSRPDIVTVTWAGDPNAGTYEAVGDSIGATDYWRQITGEYGVGAATSGKHVRLSGRLGVVSIDDLASLVSRAAGDPRFGWPTPTAQTLYVLYPPPGSVVLDGQDACGFLSGLHVSTTVNGIPVAVAIVLQCDGGGGIDPSFETSTSAHEIAEAALDPFVDRNAPAWIDLDADHFAWALMQGFQTENADLCTILPEALLASQGPSLPFTVEREWSNASAAAGHDPCVPAPPEPYFNVTPLALGTVSVDVTPLAAVGLKPFTGSPARQTKGVLLSASGDARIELGLFSDAPTEAWQLEAFEMDPTTLLAVGQGYPPTTQPTVDLQLDKASGKNGDKVTLSVHARARTPIGAALVVVKSTLGTSEHFTPLLVGGP